jgi:gliding motility-associated-like protein
MKPITTLKVLFFFALFLLSTPKGFSQCFQIESVLVDACDTGTDEGFNEMVRFKVGNASINTSTLSVNWPSNNWLGVIQNATTTAKVATLNAQITAAGGCGQLIEPVGGVLPANAKVVLVTSYNFNITLNAFGAITENIYIIFQNNPTTTTGHFANYNATPGLRTLVMSFGACSDTVSYERSLLVNINGASGGTAAEQNGSTVNFTTTGTASYTNTGCVAPVDVFTVSAGITPVIACPGATISLSGTAQGQQSVLWTATSGTFSAAASLNTNYTASPTATGAIVLTLTATNSCGQIKTSIVTVNVGGTLTPTFNPVTPICVGGNLAPLPTTSLNGVVGTWSPALNNTATTTYTFTPNVGQCATTATLIISVNTSIVPTFNPVAPICSGAVLVALPTTSTNGIVGVWTPVLNNTATATYTFTPVIGQCATTATLTITVNPVIVPTFTPVAPICSGAPLAPLPTTSLNGITGTWSPAINNTATTIYTFTPTAGQCATIATMTIVVLPAVIPIFNAVASICPGGNLAALPATSLNGITGTWSPALNNLTTTIYTFTPNAGQCAATVSLTIVVTGGIIPSFNAVAAICTGETLAALPTTSLNGITGTWSPALNNAATTTYVFTPNAGQCALTSNLTIVVNSGTTIPTFNPIAAICSGGNVSPLPTTSTNGIIGNWSPAINNSATTTYTFTPNAGQCAMTTTLQIVVENAFDVNIIGACVGNSFMFRANVIDNSGSASYDYNWQDNNGATVGTNDTSFNVSTYLNSTVEIEQLPLTFNLTVTSDAGCSKTVPFVVDNVYCGIQKGISPNGDAKNEFFDLALLDVRQLEIFNRYGTKVYSKAAYTNQWYGQTDKGDQLPDGTYYYVIEFNNNLTSKTGWIYINQ